MAPNSPVKATANTSPANEERVAPGVHVVEQRVVQSNAPPQPSPATQALVGTMGQLTINGPNDPNYDGKYYVVFRGHRPGIYTNFSEYQAQVVKFSGAIHQGYGSLIRAWAEFNAYNEQHGINEPVVAGNSTSPVAPPPVTATPPAAISAPTVSATSVFEETTNNAQYFVVIRGKNPGVYNNIDVAFAAFGNYEGDTLLRRANTQAQADRVFVAAYMAGKVFKSED